MNSATIVQKLWNYCNVLRDDGMGHDSCVVLIGLMASDLGADVEK